MQAVDDWAHGRPVAPPPSLRVFLLSRSLGGPVVDVLGADYELFRELECITDADRRAKARANAKSSKASRPGTGRRRR